MKRRLLLLIASTTALLISGHNSVAEVRYGLYLKGYMEGWSNSVNGGIAGTTGMSLQADAFTISGFDFPVQYRIHVQDQGWHYNWVTAADGFFDSGNGKRLEAIQFHFPSGIPQNEKIIARVHLQGIGWTSPGIIQEGTILGTTGQSRRLEAIEVAVGTGAGFANEEHVQAVLSALTELSNRIHKGGLPAGTAEKTNEIIAILTRNPASVSQNCAKAIANTIAPTLGLAACAVDMELPVFLALCMSAIIEDVQRIQDFQQACMTHDSAAGSDHGVGRPDSHPGEGHTEPHVEPHTEPHVEPHTEPHVEPHTEPHLEPRG